MKFKEIKAKIKKDKRKKEIKKMGKKLASGVGFVATISLATAALIYVNSDNRGEKELNQAKKTIKEIHGITEEVKEYVKQNAREMVKEIPKQVKNLEKDIPREARKFEKQLKEIIE